MELMWRRGNYVLEKALIEEDERIGPKGGKGKRKGEAMLPADKSLFRWAATP